MAIKLAILGQNWTILAPTWLYLGPSWTQLGPTFANMGPLVPERKCCARLATAERLGLCPSIQYLPAAVQRHLLQSNSLPLTTGHEIKCQILQILFGQSHLLLLKIWRSCRASVDRLLMQIRRAFGPWRVRSRLLVD